MKIQKKNFFWGGWGLGCGGDWFGGGSQGGWEQRSEACVKIQKNKNLGGGSGRGGGGGVRVGGWVRVVVN